jgi:hypothetical protein
MFITDAIGTSDQDVKNKIYEKALKVLADYGITIEWAEQNKSSRFIDELEEYDSILFTKVRNKLTREGYWTKDEKNFTLKPVTGLSTLGKVKIYQLQGKFKDDNNKIIINILSTGKADTDREARLEAFKNYIKKSNHENYCNFSWKISTIW